MDFEVDLPKCLIFAKRSVRHHCSSFHCLIILRRCRSWWLSDNGFVDRMNLVTFYDETTLLLLTFGSFTWIYLPSMQSITRLMNLNPLLQVFINVMATVSWFLTIYIVLIIIIIAKHHSIRFQKPWFLKISRRSGMRMKVHSTNWLLMCTHSTDRLKFLVAIVLFKMHP